MKESTTKENNILQCIRLVSDSARKSKLSKTYFTRNHLRLQLLADYFNVSPVQALLTSIIMAYNLRKGSASIDSIADYLEVNPIQLLEHKKDLDFLISRAILRKTSERRSRSALKLSNTSFLIAENIVEAVMNNLPAPKQESEKLSDIFDLLKRICEMGWETEEESLSKYDFIEQSRKLIDINSNLTLIEQLKPYGLSGENMVMMLYLYWRYVTGSPQVELEIAIEGIFSNPRKKFECTRAFLTNQHPIIKNNLAEVAKRRFIDDTVISLTSKSINMLMASDQSLHFKKEKRDDVIALEDIKPKQLIFGDKDFHQINQFEQCLKQENLLSIYERMETKGLLTSFTAIFYGAPGTGKTELVYQIARETGREIMFVDISKSKSCWFGESEKIVKKIFTDYEAFRKESEICPILLFNEADGIFSRRQDVGHSDVAQTENAMQNIILQELETFSGILIATTNLVSNFDKAFERRFLYKIEFHKPDLTARLKIWKLKLSELSDKEALMLAERFEFSGGQIDNIVRKFEISGILENRQPGIDELFAFCDEEKFEKSSTRKIGYLQN